MRLPAGFSAIRGIVEEVIRMSGTRISGDAHHIRSSTSTWSEVRVRDTSGGVDFYTLGLNFSVGDDVVILWYKNKRVGEKNLTTGRFNVVRYEPSGIALALNVINAILMVLGGLLFFLSPFLGLIVLVPTLLLFTISVISLSGTRRKARELIERV